MSKSSSSRKFGPACAAMTEHFQKVGEAEAAVMELSTIQAKAALMLLAQDFPKEVLESMEHEGPRA